MTTPRKNFDYNLPYINAVQQYPSQSEDYISLDMGGPRQNPVTSSNEKTPNHYNAKYYQHNARNSKTNKKNLFNSPYGQQNHRQSFNQKSRKSSEWCQHHNIRNSNEKRPQYHQNYEKKDTKPIAAYIHCSMTEDPWFELTQRFQALENSKISIKVSSPLPDKRPNTNSDEDREADSGSKKFND